MAGTDDEFTLANGIGRVAEDLDLLGGEALDGGAVEWITISQYALSAELVLC
jgi:hypothetical protein